MRKYGTRVFLKLILNINTLENIHFTVLIDGLDWFFS